MLHRSAGAAIDHHVLDGVARLHRFVDGALELDLASAAEAGVLGEDGHAAGVVDAVGDSVGGKSAEDHRVHRPDARAGQQGNRQFRRHSHVHRNAVALLDPQRLQSIGEFLYLGMQFAIGQAAHFAGLAFPDQGRLVAPLAEGVAVHAVVAQVELSAHKPLGPGQVPFEDLVPRLEPMQIPCRPGPESLGILDRFPVHLLVLLEALDVRFGAEFSRRRKDSIFAESGIQILI